MTIRVIEEHRCDKCNCKIDDPEHCVRLPRGDLDHNGIWFGDVEKFLWFEDQEFCGIQCLQAYIQEWHKLQV